MSGIPKEVEVVLTKAKYLEGRLEDLTSKKLSVLQSSGMKSEFAEKIRNQIQAGINRRDDGFLQDFFQHKIVNSGNAALNRRQLICALDELGIHLKEGDAKVMFRSLDVKNDGIMDLPQFKRAVQFPSTIEQLISTLPIPQIFADAMPLEEGTDHLRQFGQISPKQIKDICKLAMPFIENILNDAVKKIRASFAALDKSVENRVAVKFEVPPEMSAGTVGNFLDGLTGRIGLQ
jgi:hypothetical protein